MYIFLFVTAFLTIYASFILMFVLQTSDTHEKMIAMLRENHFEAQEFILSPLQFGVPYSRPRYFCLVCLCLCPPHVHAQPIQLHSLVACTL